MFFTVNYVILDHLDDPSSMSSAIFLVIQKKSLANQVRRVDVDHRRCDVLFDLSSIGVKVGKIRIIIRVAFGPDEDPGRRLPIEQVG
jgi:hypothetical protein